MKPKRGPRVLSWSKGSVSCFDRRRPLTSSLPLLTGRGMQSWGCVLLPDTHHTLRSLTLDAVVAGGQSGDWT